MTNSSGIYRQLKLREGNGRVILPAYRGFIFKSCFDCIPLEELYSCTNILYTSALA